MLRQIRLGLLASASRFGVISLVRESGWRRQKLLILSYHGIALDDEHLWNPDLYMHRTIFAERMEYLRRTQCQILPLAEGLERLRRGDLPKRSVCLTFDDGSYDFHQIALPILQRFQVPATVYLATYYVFFNRPVFDTMLRYLLWKGTGRAFHLKSIMSAPLILDMAGQRKAAAALVMNHAASCELSGQGKDDLLATVANNLGIDYDALLRRRILHFMNPKEVRHAFDSGVDIQLHTHRHRVSYNRRSFLRELDDNREKITAIAKQANPVHFCYPGGNYLEEYEGLLSGWGALSATSCDAGLCDARSNFYFLPRVVDSSKMTPLEFEAWVSGLAEVLPRRRYPPAPGQFMDER